MSIFYIAATPGSDSSRDDATEAIEDRNANFSQTLYNGPYQCHM